VNFNSFFERSSATFLSPGDLLVCTAAIAAALYAACDIFEDEETTSFILDSFCEQMSGAHDSDDDLLFAPKFIF
jgi:hypothetical protein